MSARDISARQRIARGIVVGAIAGVVASFAMDRFQAIAAKLLPADGDEGEPATQQAADVLAKAVTGHDVPDADKPLAGQAIHYALGIGLGVVYGVAAEFRPTVTAGYGSVFGLATATLLDEAAVPAVGLGDPPWTVPPSTTLYAYASHLVFGGTAEFVRRRLAGSPTG